MKKTKIYDKEYLKLRFLLKNKTKIVNYKKPKWRGFKFQLYYSVLKRRYKLQDRGKYYLPRRLVYYKHRYKNNLINKKLINLAYGKITKPLLKKITKLSLKYLKNKKKIYNFAHILFKTLESKLINILFSAHFIRTIDMGKQLIQHNKIIVNNKITNNYLLTVKKGDCIRIASKTLKTIIKENIAAYESLWPTPPKHLQVNYKTLQIIIVEDFTLATTKTFNKNRINLNKILNLYK